MWLLSAFELLIKTWRVKENLADYHVPNILRFFDGWANFLFTTSKTKPDY